MRPFVELPRVVSRVGVVPGVWLVGGAVPYVLGRAVEQPKDYDFIVEPDAYSAVLVHLRDAALSVNSCGGLKASVGGVVLDLWVSTLARFVTHGTGSVALSMLHGRLVQW